ncbi:MAG: hypothetical protein WC505_06945 [Patescibacteria group bacterium]
MSQKLRKCIQLGKVVVRNRTSGEVIVYYPLPDGSPATATISPGGSMELAPKFTTPAMLMKSNLEELARKGHVTFI